MALGFAISLLLFTALWWALTRPEPIPSVQLGFDDSYLSAEHADLINSVYLNSPAETAGIRAGDRIVEVDGQPLTGPDSVYRIWMHHQPGDQIHLTIRRPDSPAPIFVSAAFRHNPAASVSGILNQQLSNWFPVPFVIVGLSVLFLRLDDPNAWLLAVMFGGVAVSRGLPPNAVHPPGWRIAVAYQSILLGMLGPMFYWFFSVFPTRSPLDRRVPVEEVDLRAGRAGVGSGRHAHRRAATSAAVSFMGGSPQFQPHRSPNRVLPDRDGPGLVCA